MKLKTEMGEHGLMFNQCHIDENNIEWYQAPAISHDAAVAHALLQAMEQWGIDEFGVVDALKSRAAEILAGWGYPAPKSLEESKA